MINRTKSCIELLAEYEENKSIYDTHPLDINVKGMDVYNITAPFQIDGVDYIAGRVEKRNSEISQVMFFKEEKGKWIRAFREVVFEKFQDPFVTKINNNLILGGVQIKTDPFDSEKIVSWTTMFYKGKTLDSLELFATGPKKMKDIRIVELKDGTIGVFTRPQGGIYGMGKIGFIKINNLDELTEKTILSAKIYDTHFIEGEWGGVNEIHTLENNKLGVLGHIAYWIDGIRHYYSMYFIFDYITMKHTPVKIIACRGDFKKGPYKRIDLQDVLFSGGLIRKNDGTAELYTGVSDAEAHIMKIKDPFLISENWKC